MREDDGEEHEGFWHLALFTEGLDAVDGVQREPTDHEEEHDDTQALGGLHFPPAGVGHLTGHLVNYDEGEVN